MPLQFEDALAFLQKCQSTEGPSVMEHLTTVLAKVLEDRPDGAIELLETSLLSKKSNAEVKGPAALVPVSSAADAARAVASASLFGYPDQAVDPDSGEPIEPDAPAEFECEDIVADGALFDALGVGLGRQEMYAAMLAAKKLGGDAARGVATVRFFGKFFGLHANYYVFETTLNEAPEVPEAPEGQVPYEASGAGANNYVYFVCSYLGGPFTQLPHVLPDEIKAARLVKKYLTGRLDAHVSTYPLFPGTEANFLRAQITRIACSTVCCPNNSFLANEDGGLEKNEEWEGLKEREAGHPSSWAHRYPHLKTQGRCELYKRDPPDGEEEGYVYNDARGEEEKEEGPAPLATLDVDAMLADGTSPSWSGISSSVQQGVHFQVGGTRSNLWPGAFCAAKGRHFTNLYVGWGLKNAPYAPLPPPAMAKEFEGSLVESAELPPKPKPPAADGEEEDE